MSSSVIVGQDCSVEDVSSAFVSTPTFAQKFPEIAFTFGATREFVQDVNGKILEGQGSYRESLKDVIDQWVTKKKDSATLESLLASLIEKGLGESAVSITTLWLSDKVGTSETEEENNEKLVSESEE